MPHLLDWIDMTGPNATQDVEEEKPLDPAAERVRRKLVRFMGINLAILFAAVMAVVLAVVYQSLAPSDGAETASSPPVPSGESFDGSIALPENAQVVSHGVSGNRLTLYLRNADGSEVIRIFDLDAGRSLGAVEILRDGQ